MRPKLFFMTRANTPQSEPLLTLLFCWSYVFLFFDRFFPLRRERAGADCFGQGAGRPHDCRRYEGGNKFSAVHESRWERSKLKVVSARRQEAGSWETQRLAAMQSLMTKGGEPKTQYK